MQVRSLGWEDLLEEETATHSSILAWKTPWSEEPGGLQSIGVTKSQTRLKRLSTQTKVSKKKLGVKGWGFFRLDGYGNSPQWVIFTWNLNDEKEPACRDLEEELCRKRQQRDGCKETERGEAGCLKHTGDEGGTRKWLRTERWAQERTYRAPGTTPWRPTSFHYCAYNNILFKLIYSSLCE